MEKDAGSLAVAGDANMLATSKSILAATFIVTPFQWVAPSAPMVSYSRLRRRRFERGGMPRKLRGGGRRGRERGPYYRDCDGQIEETRQDERS